MVKMMKSNKGVTIVELLLSVIIISLVLVFIIQLCLRARNAYLSNSVNVKYELSKGIIIDAVMDDYIKVGLKSINQSGNNVTFNLSDGTTKTLSVISSGDSYIVKYSGGTDPTVGRKYLSEDIQYNGINVSSKMHGENKLTKCRINLVGKDDSQDYSIEMYFLDV